MSLPNHLVPDKEMLLSLFLLCIGTNQSESFHTINSQCLMSCFLLFSFCFYGKEQQRCHFSSIERYLLSGASIYFFISTVLALDDDLSLRGSVHFGSLQMGPNNSKYPIVVVLGS